MTESTDDFPAAHQYSFSTERLYYRPLHLDDTEAIFALRSDPQVYYWTVLQKEESEAQAWIRERLGSDCYLSFCIEELSDAHDHGAKEERPQVIGVCGGTHLPEIGYIFRPSVWGRGYATEAVKGFIKFYWETFPNGHPSLSDADERKFLKAVTGPPEDDRSAAASIAVLKKCGFEYWKDQEEGDNPTRGQKIMLLVWRHWGPGHRPH
ncbi:MAG: hypothetical protein L6R38_009115 [Xanthoria sp. 2 TBL-2021]|nr:MAG: hypothetical protein L6R38_009115 [Xanthoria sp. 2 TBL-2021]